MERIELKDEALENVTGGSILISPDNKTIGYNCNNQAKINNYSACVSFINENLGKMDERDIMRALVSKGYITRL